jgi:hypothetical protein
MVLIVPKAGTRIERGENLVTSGRIFACFCGGIE